MSEVKEVRIKDIITNPYQPRFFFDEAAIETLAASIKENGLVQPITLRVKNNGYELIAGERRLRASESLGLEYITAYIISSSDEESMYLSLIENIQREDLSAIEEAKAYVNIMQLHNMTQKELAKQIGKSQPSVANKVRLLQLDNHIQEAVEAKVINERHARAMLGLSTDDQKKVLSQIIQDDLTVAETEKLIKPKKEKPVVHSVGYSRNVQIGINTIKQAVKMARKTGLDVDVVESETDNEVVLEVRFKK